MTIDVMTLLKPLLKRRFTETGVYIEGWILDHLGEKYYNGDRVVWERHRQHGYKMFRAGKSAEDIAFYHEVPMLVANWWIEIWERYDAAWGFLNER